MSTRVLPVGGFVSFNMRMSELRHRLQPIPGTQSESASEDASAPVLPTRTVRRNLFGPIDHDENMKFVQEELSKIAYADSRRWNFDFQNDQPLQGRFSWEETKEATVPAAYDMPNLTSRLKQLTSSTPSTSKVTSAVTTSSITASTSRAHEVSSVDTRTPLETTLQSVTTASTTVVTTTAPRPKKAPDEALGEGTLEASQPTKDPSDQPKSSALSICSKQTRITDFLRIRKRAHSPTDVTDQKDQDTPTPPLLKKSRTSST